MATYLFIVKIDKDIHWVSRSFAVGKPVPAKLYQGEAEVLSYVYKLRKAG